MTNISRVVHGSAKLVICPLSLSFTPPVTDTGRAGARACPCQVGAACLAALPAVCLLQCVLPGFAAAGTPSSPGPDQAGPCSRVGARRFLFETLLLSSRHVPSSPVLNHVPETKAHVRFADPQGPVQCCHGACGFVRAAFWPSLLP